MKQCLFILLLLSAAFAAGQSVSNNTSACSANGVPTTGCNGVGGMPFLGNPADIGAETTVLNPLPTNVSPLSVKSMLYAGATTRIMAEYQPWFCNTSSPCNGHKVNGMEESNPAQVLEQAKWMKTVGADVVDVDYYGCSTACGQGSGQAYNLSVTSALANAIAANPSITPTFLIMLDGGSVDGSGVGQCPPASGDQSACLSAAFEAQVDYLAQTWLYQSYYETNASDGNPIVMYFVGTGDWPDTNFSTVYAAVKAHATAGNSCGSGCTYTRTVDFVDENSGAFSESGIDGGYAWVQPQVYSSTAQFCWKGSSCTGSGYLAGFYSAARANPSQIAVGALYKGFNDYNAGWGSNRVMAQQCGNVLGLTAGAITAAGYNSTSQLQYAQLVTWNDYEESTEVETGVSNCYTITTPTISGSTLSWSLSSSDSYASTSTISSFSIYTGTGTPTTLYASGISPTSTSHVAPTLSPGQSVWVYMVGSPLIQNQLSPPSTAGVATGYTITGGAFLN